MKKSLIALAVAGVIAAPAAMADVTIYGQANVSFDSISNGALVNSASASNISSNVSRLGFKGSEDLGDGLSAIWQIEQSVNFDSSSNSTAVTAVPKTVTANNGILGNRNTFAGLSSTSLGTVLMGTHDTPYKIATRGYDVFADTVADNRSVMGGAALHDARLGNVIAYISPAMSGFTVAFATVAGSETPVANSTKADVWSLAALYNQAPFSGSLSYQTIKVGTAGVGTFGAGSVATAGAGLLGLAAGTAAPVVNDKTTAFKLGGSYTMDALVINAVYEKLSYTAAANGSDVLNESNVYLSGKYSISANDAVKLAYTIAGKNNNLTTAQVANTGAKQFTIGYDHNLSKRTSVYALYSKLSNDSLAAYTFSQATSAANANGGAGSSPSVVSLGMKHAF